MSALSNSAHTGEQGRWQTGQQGTGCEFDRRHADEREEEAQQVTRESKVRIACVYSINKCSFIRFVCLATSNIFDFKIKIEIKNVQ